MHFGRMKKKRKQELLKPDHYYAGQLLYNSVVMLKRFAGPLFAIAAVS
jgi:hypothetical protein